MSNANWERAFAPSTAVTVISFLSHSSGGQALLDLMNITATDAAALDGNVNVAVFEGLELEFLLFELRPFLLVIDHEALGGLWVRHCGGLGSSCSVETPLRSEICRLNKSFNRWNEGETKHERGRQGGENGGARNGKFKDGARAGVEKDVTSCSFRDL